jgi:hypothetical protein
MSVGQMLTKSDRWPGKIGRTAKIGLILAVSCKRPLNNYGETSTPKGDTDAHLLGVPPLSTHRFQLDESLSKKNAHRHVRLKSF